VPVASTPIKENKRWPCDLGTLPIAQTDQLETQIAPKAQSSAAHCDAPEGRYLKLETFSRQWIFLTFFCM
jgi:hypothetical protein